MSVYEEEINGFIYREYRPFGRPKFLVIGLPDVGLVGEIAAVHLIRSLGLIDTIGIDSYTMLPPVAVIRAGESLCPIRIYSGDSLAVMVTDVALSPRAIVPLTLSIVEFSRLRGIELLIGITGVVNPERAELEKPNVYWLASTPEAQTIASRIQGARRAEDGYIVGPYAILIKESIRRRVNTVIIMADSFLDIPDPEAAAETLKALSQITGVPVPIDKLVEEGELVKLRMKELMKETRSALARMGKGYEYRAPIVY